MSALYHYTCDHGRQRLGDTGEVLPGAMLADGAIYWTALFAWFTDMTKPDRDGLGLTSHLVRCDRTAHRYRVTGGVVTEWCKVARALPREYREAIENAPGSRPRHWFVADEPVPVVYDPIGVSV